MGALLRKAFLLTSRTARLGVRYPIAKLRRTRGAVTFRCREGKLSLRVDDSDAIVYEKIFVSKEYDTSKLRHHRRIEEGYAEILAGGHRPIIIDCGGNIGLSALWFSLRYPEALIVCLEPDPVSAGLAERNTASRDNIVVCRAGVGCVGGSASAVPRSQSWATQTARSPAGEVKLHSIADVMAMHGDGGRLFMVKIDIEGFEKDLFSRNTEWMHEACVMIIELHDWMLPEQGASFTLFDALPRRTFETIISGENLIFVRARQAAARDAMRPAAELLPA